MRNFIYPEHDELIHLLQYEIRMPEALNEAITTLRGISEAMLNQKTSRLRIMEILENYRERYKKLIEQSTKNKIIPDKLQPADSNCAMYWALDGMNSLDAIQLAYGPGLTKKACRERKKRLNHNEPFQAELKRLLIMKQNVKLNANTVNTVELSDLKGKVVAKYREILASQPDKAPTWAAIVEVGKQVIPKTSISINTRINMSPERLMRLQARVARARSPAREQIVEAEGVPVKAISSDSIEVIEQPTEERL